MFFEALYFGHFLSFYTMQLEPPKAAGALPRSRIRVSQAQMPELNQKRETKREALCYVIFWLLIYD